jgi:hypothetical protein
LWAPESWDSNWPRATLALALLANTLATLNVPDLITAIEGFMDTWKWIRSWRNCNGAGKPSKTSSRDAPCRVHKKGGKNNSSRLGDSTLVYYRDGKLHRISADTCDGEVAEAKARSMMAAFDAAAKGEPTPTPAVNSSYLIDELVKAFVAKKSADSVKRKTAGQWNTELTWFATFLRDRGLVNIGDVRPDDVQIWRDGLEGSSAARRKSVTFVVAFFNYCVDFDKLVKSPAIKSQLF